jgi:hypothetical protein
VLLLAVLGVLAGIYTRGLERELERLSAEHTDLLRAITKTTLLEERSRDQQRQLLDHEERLRALEHHQRH